METVTDFIFLGSKIVVDGDCSHEIKRCLLLGRTVTCTLTTSNFESMRQQKNAPSSSSTAPLILSWASWQGTLALNYSNGCWNICTQHITWKSIFLMLTTINNVRYYPSKTPMRERIWQNWIFKLGLSKNYKSRFFSLGQKLEGAFPVKSQVF